MKTIVSVLAVLALVGCGASVSTPTNRLASSEAAVRAARELGASENPSAALHLELADEQMAQARSLMSKGKNKTADRMLQRASADAELAVMLTKESSAEAEANRAKTRIDRSNNGPSAPERN